MSNTKLAMYSGMDVHYRRKGTPTSAILYNFRTSVSKYGWCPIIDKILYMYRTVTQPVESVTLLYLILLVLLLSFSTLQFLLLLHQKPEHKNEWSARYSSCSLVPRLLPLRAPTKNTAHRGEPGNEATLAVVNFTVGKFSQYSRVK